MRTPWVANITGCPFACTATVPGATRLGLEEAHRNLKISPEEFDEVAAVLKRGSFGLSGLEDLFPRPLRARWIPLLLQI
jgi:hypothetical protein